MGLHKQALGAIVALAILVGGNMPTLADYGNKYRGLLTQARQDGRLTRQIDAAAKYIIRHKKRYKGVEAGTGVPWYFIGALHWRESAGDFKGVLHNGEKIIGTGKRTRLEPPGKGPFKTWEDSALDALCLKSLHRIKEWTDEQIAFAAEMYNGWGYWNRGLPSAYVFSGTTVYKSGKFVRDRVFSNRHVDTQPGIWPIVQKVRELEAPLTVAVHEQPQPVDLGLERGELIRDSSKAGMLHKVGMAAKGVAGAAGGVFTLDTLGAFQGWMGLFAGIGKFALIMGVCVLGYMVLSKWLLDKMADDQKAGRYVPSGAEGKTDVVEVTNGVA